MYDVKIEIKKTLKEALAEAKEETIQSNVIPIMTESSSIKFQEYWQSNHRQFKGGLITILCLCAMLFILNPDNFLGSGFVLPSLIFIVMLVISYLCFRFEEIENRFGRWVFGRVSGERFSFKWYFKEGK